MVGSEVISSSFQIFQYSALPVHSLASAEHFPGYVYASACDASHSGQPHVLATRAIPQNLLLLLRYTVFVLAAPATFLRLPDDDGVLLYARRVGGHGLSFI